MVVIVAVVVAVVWHERRVRWDDRKSVAYLGLGHALHQQHLLGVGLALLKNLVLCFSGF